MSEDNTPKTENNQQFCSFCGKAVYEVKKLVSGRNVCICDECINLCNDIMAEDNRQTDNHNGDACRYGRRGDMHHRILGRIPIGGCAPRYEQTYVHSVLG